MVLLGFSVGTSDETSGIGKSLDEIISDRRKEQAKASTGRATKDTKQANNGRKSAAKDKKTAAADRSIATGRAKRAAATKARRGLANNGEKKPTAMEIDKEVYRQARKTTAAKKKAEKKASNGRLAPNSSLRNKNNKNANNNNNSKTRIPADQSQGVVFGRMPQKKQIAAALKGMEAAGCPIPEGHQLVMQFAPSVAPQELAKAQKTNNTRSNKNNNNTNNNKTNNRNNNKTNNRNNNNNNNKTNNRNKKNGKK